MDIANTIIMIIVLLGLLAALVFIQIQISRKNNGFLAYVLPGIFLVRSMITSFGVLGSASMLGTIWTVISYFVVLNIPTVVLLAIHFTVRNKTKANNQLNKMNIKDL